MLIFMILRLIKIGENLLLFLHLAASQNSISFQIRPQFQLFIFELIWFFVFCFVFLEWNFIFFEFFLQKIIENIKCYSWRGKNPPSTNSPRWACRPRGSCRQHPSWSMTNSPGPPKWFDRPYNTTSLVGEVSHLAHCIEDKANLRLQLFPDSYIRSTIFKWRSPFFFSISAGSPFILSHPTISSWSSRTELHYPSIKGCFLSTKKDMKNTHIFT